MRKIVFFLILLVSTSKLFAQTNYAADSITARYGFKIGTKKVVAISNNSTASSKDSTKLITEEASKKYTDSKVLSGGGLKKVYAGNGLSSVNDSTLKADTSILATNLGVKNKLDSIGGIISTKGTVNSVGLTTPTGFDVSNSPITSSGVMPITYASGYGPIPTTAAMSLWDIAYNNRITSATYPFKIVSNVGSIDTGRGLNQVVTGGDLNGVKDSLAAIVATKGSVSTLTRTNGVGIIATVTNPTTTPNIDIKVDTADASIISRQRAASTYEPTIALNGTTKKYWTGYKTWGSFNDTVRAAISLTTTGSSGAATYNNSTGVFNVPTYSLSGLGGIDSIRCPADVLYANASFTKTGTTGISNASLNSQTQNTFFAAPNGSSGTPTFRSIVGADIPNSTIDLTTKVTGVLPLANGGTGSSTKNFVDLTNAQTIAGNKTFSVGTAGVKLTSTVSGNAGNFTITPDATAVGTAADFTMTNVGRFTVANFQTNLNATNGVVVANSLTYSSNSFVMNGTTATLGQNVYCNSQNNNGFYGFGQSGTKVSLYFNATGSWNRGDFAILSNNAATTSSVSYASDSKFRLYAATGDVTIGDNIADVTNCKFKVATTTGTGHPFPNMTSAQRTALTMTSSNYGDMVYQTDGTEGVYVYKSTGWVFAY